MKVGILSVQGDFAAHSAMLQSLGVQTIEVRTLAGLAGSDALILPGGESTTQLQFLQEEGLFEAIQKFAANDGPIFGTCAGAILLANEVKNPHQTSLGLLNISILRNGYGRQMASDVGYGPTTLPGKTTGELLEMVFIRAPIIEHVGPGVQVLAEYDGKPTLVRKRNILASTFHPELSADPSVHRYFISFIFARDKQDSPVRAGKRR